MNQNKESTKSTHHPALCEIFQRLKVKCDISPLPLGAFIFSPKDIGLNGNLLILKQRYHRYSRCVELLEFGDGLGLLAGHEPINDEADNQGEEEEVQVAEKRLTLIHRGLGVGSGLSVHVRHVDTTWGQEQNKTLK